MHAHIPSGAQSRSYRDDVLFLYVANGVTFARGMLGDPEHLALRAELAAHRVLGPRLYASGLSLNGDTVKSPEEGSMKVREQEQAGYDFLKLHPGFAARVRVVVIRT